MMAFESHLKVETDDLKLCPAASLQTSKLSITRVLYERTSIDGKQS